MISMPQPLFQDMVLLTQWLSSFHWFWALGFPKNTKCSSFALMVYHGTNCCRCECSYWHTWKNDFTFYCWYKSKGLNQPFNFCVTEEGANLMVLTSWAFKYYWQSTRLFTFPACHFLGLRCLPQPAFSAYGLLMSCNVASPQPQHLWSTFQKD